MEGSWRQPGISKEDVAGGLAAEGRSPQFEEDDPMGLEGNGAGMGAEAC